eukprot:549780_1
MPRKQKNKSKSTKQKRKQQQKHNAPSTKPLRLRTSLDIYNRLLHDRTLDINLKNVFIGYTDNDNAIKRTSEMCILSWVMVNKGGDIPMHHIVYFCLILNDRSKLMIWDRHKKLDRLYKWVYPAVKKCLDDNGTLTEEYWKWRDTGMKHQKAVRFPVGRANRFECLYSVVDRGNPQPVNYIEARKKIYIPQYTAALIQCDKFKQLKRMYEDGQYLLISEFDGPLYQDYDYYQDKYGKMDIVLEGNVMIPTKENLKILLNDTKHPFGHGYCIAMALQGITVEDLL